MSCLTPVPEEWLIERDWFIVNHWEDQFCRDVYRDLCVHAELQHLRAIALLSPGTTPLVCPVDTLVNSPTKPLQSDGVMQTLAPCSRQYVLNMDDLARFRLKARSDVVGTWAIAFTTLNNFYCQVKINVTTQCFTPTTSKSGASYCAERSDKVDSTPVNLTRVLLLPVHLDSPNWHFLR